MVKILEYNVEGVNWVTIHSITPINKVKKMYDGFNTVLENEIVYVVLWINRLGKLKSDEIAEYNFEKDIRITYNND